MADELVLTGCPEPGCDAPAEVVRTWATYPLSGLTTWFTPVQRIVHVRTRCLNGHERDEVVEGDK